MFLEIITLFQLHAKSGLLQCSFNFLFCNFYLFVQDQSRFWWGTCYTNSLTAHGSVVIYSLTSVKCIFVHSANSDWNRSQNSSLEPIIEQYKKMFVAFKIFGDSWFFPKDAMSVLKRQLAYNSIQIQPGLKAKLSIIFIVCSNKIKNRVMLSGEGNAGEQ